MADLVLAGLFAVVAVIITFSISDSVADTEIARPENLLQWLIVFGGTWVLPFRRIAPSVAVVAGGFLQAVVWGFSFPDTYTATALLIYSAAAHGGTVGRRWSWIIGSGLTLYTGLGVLTDSAPLYALPIVGFFSLAAAALGSTTASRQAYAQAAVARAVEGERSRASERDRALVEERARIARELHDVVAHGLSVIVVQASAAQRIIDRDPDGATHALQQIEQTGRTSLNEMRQVLAAIRTEPDESWQPTPGLASLDALVEEMASTGLKVTVRHELDEPANEPLPATVDLTAYRIVQESLTNVLKHGGRGARAQVDIARRPRSLDLRITDNGRGAAADDQGGHGLRGMQERVEVFGGRFSAGPQAGGGFAVSVSLPLDGAGADALAADGPVGGGVAD